MKEIKKMVLTLAVAVFLLVLAAATTKAQPPRPGGYQNVSAKDREVVKASKFAVRAKREQTGENLTGLKVLKARQQVVRGFNFKMCLRVKENGSRKTAEAVVNKFMGKYELLEWKWKGCQ